jgi:hypothetical protein
MAQPDKQRGALQIIFSFFLGLMVTAFIGVGVYTFYPPPEQRYQDRLQELYRQQEDIQNFKEPSSITPAERARLRAIQADIRKLEDAQQAAREVWGRNTSIILIAFATLVMSISLIMSDSLKVISNGLLLGGLFTMLYGTGWIIATGTSQARFFVMTAALAITLVLGYVRFVRERRGESAAVVQTAAAPAPGTPAPEVASLVARVEALERRNAALAAALTEDGRRTTPE